MGRSRSEESEASEGLGLPPELRWFLWVSGVFAALSWTVAIWLWRAGYKVLGGMWAAPDDRFTDLTHYDAIFPYLHTELFFTGQERFAYPAPAAVLYDALLHVTTHRLLLSFAIAAVLAVVSAVLFGRKLVSRGIGAGSATALVVGTVVFSWPLLFLLERGNIELFLIVLTFAGAWAFWRDQTTAAAVLWGAAGAIKLYPLLLLALFCYRSQIRALLAGVVTAVAVLVGSFWFVGPTIGDAARGTVAGLVGFVGTYATKSREGELRHDHSFLAFVKQPLAIHRLHFSSDVHSLGTGYAAVAVLACVVLYFARFRRLPALNQYALVMIAIVALPPVSYDYTLVHLYPSFGLLILLLLALRREGRDAGTVRTLLWCFTLIFASENFAMWLAFHMNGMVKAAALFWAGVVLLRTPLPKLPAEDVTTPVLE